MAVEFYVVVLLLLLLAAMFVVFPILRHHGAGDTRRRTNVEVFRERQAELDAELEKGLITEPQYEGLTHELQRRLLEDEAAAAGVDGRSDKPPRWFVLGVLALMVAVALGLYQFNGAGPDWEIKQTLELAQRKAAAGENFDAERAALLDRVEARLQDRPEQPFYLLLRGNLQMEMGRYREAESSFARLLEVVPNDPAVMAVWLEMRYVNGGRKLSDADLAFAHRILEIDPRNVRTLGLLGINSFETGRYSDAVGYWQQLLPLVGPFSPNGKMISQGIERAQALLAQQGGEAPAAAQPTAAASSLTVAVSLADGISADRGMQVFVYARPTNGSRMPLAVQRLTVADLPAEVTLNDSMAMAPGMNLSSVEEVELVARISSRGMANRGSGDIEGVRGPISLAEVDGAVSLVIDSVVP